MAKPTICLLRPTIGLIEEYALKNDNEFDLGDKALEMLLSTFKRNIELIPVLIKVAAINSIYQTRIGDVGAVAEKIVKISDVDIRLARGDATLVNEIAKVKYLKADKERNNVSFASKYCYCHNPKGFFIFDRRANDLLNHYKKKIKGIKITKDECRTYSKYLVLVNAFLNHYGLYAAYKEGSLDCSKIDRFLWIHSQEIEKKIKNEGGGFIRKVRLEIPE